MMQIRLSGIALDLAIERKIKLPPVLDRTCSGARLHLFEDSLLERPMKMIECMIKLPTAFYYHY
jgi:hypothetical protein